MDITLTHLALAAIGLAAGIGLGLLIGRRGPSGQKAARMAAEHQQYRQDVAEHFARTADLVNGMTDSYKAVFDHLQGGARELLDDETLRQTLADQSDEVITLNRLGWQANPAAASASAAVVVDSVTEPEQDAKAEPVGGEPTDASLSEGQSADTTEDKAINDADDPAADGDEPEDPESPSVAVEAQKPARKKGPDQ